MKKILLLILILFVYLYPMPYTLSPVFAVDIESNYGFGWVGSLGEGLSRLIAPGIAIAAIAVVFYFLIGAVKLLTSGGDKGSVSEAKDMITHAIIGFVLLMVILMILQFLMKFFGIDLKIF